MAFIGNNPLTGTPTDFSGENPILEAGQLGIEIDVRNGVNTVPTKAKMGDGVTRYNDLEYWNPNNAAPSELPVPIDEGGTGATTAEEARENLGVGFISVPSQVERTGAVIVAGAGTSAANGIYTERGTSGGKPFYNLVGEADNTEAYSIAWSIGDSDWYISDFEGSVLYVSSGSDDTQYPWEVVTWTEANGSLPVPTVTFQAGLTGLARGAQVYQEDNGFTYVLIDPDNPSSAASWQAVPKVWRGVINQSGTDAPVAIVGENTLGASIVWAFDSTGTFHGTCDLGGGVGAFTGPTMCFLAQEHNGFQFEFHRSSDLDVGLNAYRLVIDTGEIVGDPANGAIINMGAEIYVYPA